MSCAALSSSTATARPRAAAAAAAAARGGETRMCAGLGAAAGPRRSSTSSCVLSSFRGTRVHSKARALSAPSSTTAMPLRVECANPRRVAKVQQQMRREISTMLQTDKNIRSMISPEERMGVDNVISVMVTVADVEVSNDLQVVKVFVSILGDERGKKNALNGLKKLEGYVRRNIGKRVSLRLTPEIRFVYDDSFERGQRVSSLLDVLRVERDGSDAAGNVAPGKYSKNELLALEDTITNPYEDDEDGDFAMGEDDEEEDDEEEEGGDGDEDMDDMDVEQMWEEMQKDAGSKSKGDDDLINVQ